MISLAQLWAPVEIALNNYLALDPSSGAKLAPVRGKIIALELRGVAGRVLLRVGDGAIHVIGQTAHEPDCTIRASLFTWFRLGLSKNVNSTAVMGDVDLDGDVHTARRFQKFWYSVDIDWEEHLSRVVGDVAAHQIGRLARVAGGWLRQTGNSLQQDAVEYLQEESRQLAVPAQVNQFLSDVDQLRHDVDRLRVRVQRLQVAVDAKGSGEG